MTDIARWWRTTPVQRVHAMVLAIATLSGCSSASESVDPPQPVCTGPAASCSDECDVTAVESCGACDVVCSAPRLGVPVCEDRACTFDCSGGTVRCGDECVPQCETAFAAPGEWEFEVPRSCGRLEVDAWGAGGGHGNRNAGAGAGGAARGTFAVEPGMVLAVVVGSAGQDSPGRTPGGGGAPGGGFGGNSSRDGGGGGGGFSGVFMTAVASESALVIAGGGGGSGGGNSETKVRAGAGGGEFGQAGGGAPGGPGGGGFAALAGGPGGSQNSGDGGGGGGGGWFGGDGGAGANTDASGGGGGSGYVAPSAGSGELFAGNRRAPGNPDHPDRGSAGDPRAPGRVIIRCLPEAN